MENKSLIMYWFLTLMIIIFKFNNFSQGRHLKHPVGTTYEYSNKAHSISDSSVKADILQKDTKGKTGISQIPLIPSPLPNPLKPPTSIFPPLPNPFQPSSPPSLVPPIPVPSISPPPGSIIPLITTVPPLTPGLVTSPPPLPTPGLPFALPPFPSFPPFSLPPMPGLPGKPPPPSKAKKASP